RQERYTTVGSWRRSLANITASGYIRPKTGTARGVMIPILANQFTRSRTARWPLRKTSVSLGEIWSLSTILFTRTMKDGQSDRSMRIFRRFVSRPGELSLGGRLLV